MRAQQSSKSLSDCKATFMPMFLSCPVHAPNQCLMMRMVVECKNKIATCKIFRHPERASCSCPNRTGSHHAASRASHSFTARPSSLGGLSSSPAWRQDMRGWLPLYENLPWVNEGFIGVDAVPRCRTAIRRNKTTMPNSSKHATSAGNDSRRSTRPRALPVAWQHRGLEWKTGIARPTGALKWCAMH